MKNIKTSANGTAGAKEQKVPVEKLPVMEMYAVLGLELGKQIFEKLTAVEESVAILARQKARELNPEEPEAPAAK